MYSYQMYIKTLNPVDWFSLIFIYLFPSTVFKSLYREIAVLSYLSNHLFSLFLEKKRKKYITSICICHRALLWNRSIFFIYFDNTNPLKDIKEVLLWMKISIKYQEANIKVLSFIDFDTAGDVLKNLHHRYITI